MEYKFKMFENVRDKTTGRIGAIINQHPNGTYDLLEEQPYWHQEYYVKEDDLERLEK